MAAAEISQAAMPLVVAGEVAVVIAEMRKNQRFQRRQDTQDPLIISLSELRRMVFQEPSVCYQQPLQCFEPFLNVARAKDVSGLITAAAVQAVHRLLTLGFIDPASEQAPDVINHVAQCVMWTRFVPAGAEENDRVTAQILEALGACIQCRAGSFLSSERIAHIIQLAYLVGEKASDSGGTESSALLRHVSASMMSATIHTVFTRIAQAAASSEGAGASAEDALGTALAVLESLLDLLPVDQQAASSTDKVRLVLELLDTALKVGGSVLARSLNIIEWVTGVLFHRLLEVAAWPGYVFLPFVTNLMLTLYSQMGRFMLLQLDAFVREFLLRLGEGRDPELPREAQEAALEGLLDFIFQPQFLTDIYASLDCRIERSNLFEEICSLLSRVVQKRGKFEAVTNVQRLCMEAFANMLQVLDAACTAGARPSFEYAARMPALRRLLQAAGSGLPKAPGQGRDGQGGQGAAGNGEAGDGANGTIAAALAGAALDAAAGEGRVSYVDIWSQLEGRGWTNVALVDPSLDQGSRQANLAMGCLLEKTCKQILQVAAEYFNKTPSKAYEYLQGLGLLPTPLDTKAVAMFLRHSPGLFSSAKGEILGDHSDFNQVVLKDFIRTLDFTDMQVDDALRLLLDNFRIPGESQKILRMTEAFAQWYYESCSLSSWAKHTDVIQVFTYAMIMLHTDQHSSQVADHKRMTEDMFVRNLRGINKENDKDKGEDLPVDMLKRIYHNIRSNEMRMSEDVDGLTYAQLLHIRQDSRHLRGQTLRLSPADCPFIDLMLSFMWGPAASALLVILETAHDAPTSARALAGLQSLLSVASHFRMSEVIDSVVLAVCRMTQSLNAGTKDVLVELGRDVGLQVVIQFIFDAVHKYQEHLSSAWRQVVDLVVRLWQIGLVELDKDMKELMEKEERANDLENGDEAGTAAPLPGPGDGDRDTGQPQRQGTMMDWLWGTAKKEEKPRTPGEEEKVAAAREAVAQCRIGDLWSDSKYYAEESLVAFVEALMSATGLDTATLSETRQRFHGLSEQARLNHLIMGLNLVAGVAIRNKDRVAVLWPSLKSALQSILPAGAPLAKLLASRESVVGLVQRAVHAVMLLCRRVSHEPSGFEACVQSTLQLIVRTDTSVMWELAVFLADELRRLLLFNAARIMQPQAWKPLTHILSMCCLHAQASPVVLDILVTAFKAQPPTVTLANFEYLISLLVKAFEAREEQGQLGSAKHILVVLEDAGTWLCASGRQHAEIGEGYPGMTQQQRADLLRGAWRVYVATCVRMGIAPHAAVRNAALSSLQRFLTRSEGLPLGRALWAEALSGESGIVPLLEKLLGLVGRPAFPEGDKTLVLGLGAMSRAILQDVDVAQVWQQALTVLESCMSLDSAELAGAVPDILRNLLLVLSSKGILKPGWRDASGRDLWQITWRMSRSISQALSPESLLGQRL